MPIARKIFIFPSISVFNFWLYAVKSINKAVEGVILWI